jgi:hypothetical protein
LITDEDGRDGNPEPETTMTTAASRFTSGIQTSWDHRDCYEQTARRGLSDVDTEALRAICEETGEDYDAAESEVMDFVRAKVS